MKTFFLMLALIQIGCNAQNKGGSSSEKEKHIIQEKAMETFDIETFNKKKNLTENYKYTSENDEVIEESGGLENGDYIRVKYLANNHFKSFYRFYPNGTLKIKGMFYENDFASGVWDYYDKEGKVEKTIDYDQPFTYSWDDILKYVEDKKIDLLKNTTRISRTTEGSVPTWTVTWHYDSGRLKAVNINGETGEIIEEKFLIMEKL